MTKRMKRLDRTASLPIHSQDEIGVLKQQINDLYHHLLEVIDNLEQQKQENLKLEQMKVEFLRGPLHELKTPLASLKIILENMRDKIGCHKDRDRYLSVSLDIVDEMNQIVLEILSLSLCPRIGRRQGMDPVGSGRRADPRPVQGLGSISLAHDWQSNPWQSRLYGPSDSKIGSLKCYQ